MYLFLLLLVAIGIHTLEFRATLSRGALRSLGVKIVLVVGRKQRIQAMFRGAGADGLTEKRV